MNGIRSLIVLLCFTLNDRAQGKDHWAWSEAKRSVSHISRELSKNH